MAVMTNLKQMTMIFSIVERGSAGKLTKLYTDHQVFTNIRCEGTGTATSEIMDILGLGSSEKDILLSFTPLGAARALLEKLNDELRGAVPGRGIAFTVPLSAVSNLAAAVIGSRTKLEKDTEVDDMQHKSSLILVTVNQGFTDVVMETAKKAGARGGTIVRGRWVHHEDFESLAGFAAQDEKEIILIVVPKEIRNTVMEAINEKHGLQSEAGAMVCAMGVDEMVSLG